MFSALWQFFFGCHHDNYSFPMSNKGTRQRSAAGGETGTYVVCLDCGQEFAYDWSKMKVISRLPAQRVSVSQPVHSFALK